MTQQLLQWNNVYQGTSIDYVQNFFLSSSECLYRINKSIQNMQENLREQRLMVKKKRKKPPLFNFVDVIGLQINPEGKLLMFNF